MTGANIPAVPESLPQSKLATTLRRILEFPVTNLVLGTACVVGSVLLVDALLGAFGASRFSRDLTADAGSLLAILAVCVAYAGYVRLVERRPAVELGREGLAVDLGIGLTLGALLFAATVLVLCLLGACAIETGEGWGPLRFAVMTSLCTAVFEELWMRGVLFRVLEKSLGSWLALAISAVAFGLIHAANPGASAQSTVAIALEAGVLLAAAFIYSRRLWMPIGLHAAWNFTQGGVFGASVSGGAAHGYFSARFSGSELLTGGAFGPEASVAAVVVCLAAAGGLIALARRRGRIVPPFWRRARSSASLAA
ncbi:MAG TPA: CPBP family intramembrane metalloprotease [Myxococcales bacterium]|nr:CPBP family intramembrane metalloprotease [Myxococcales bacterium]